MIADGLSAMGSVAAVMFGVGFLSGLIEDWFCGWRDALAEALYRGTAVGVLMFLFGACAVVSTGGR